MKTLNWAKRYIWMDGEMNEIANVLMNQADDNMTLAEIKNWYDKGFYLQTKSTDEIESNYPLDFEDVERIFEEEEEIELGE